MDVHQRPRALLNVKEAGIPLMSDPSQLQSLEAPTHLGVENRTAFFTAASDLLKQLPKGTGTLVVDLSHTHYVDAAGLSTLALIQRKAAEYQSIVRLKNPNDEVRFSIVLAGMDDLFEMDVSAT